jgi:hypothetical protein
MISCDPSNAASFPNAEVSFPDYFARHIRMRTSLIADSRQNLRKWTPSAGFGKWPFFHRRVEPGSVADTTTFRYAAEVLHVPSK